jgi:hypothetical protein
MIDKTFTNWTVVGRSNRKTKSREYYWWCKCSCGTAREVRGSLLRNGDSKSCGCYRASATEVRFLKHGHSAGGKVSLTYTSWGHLVSRCTNKNNAEYGNYGGRGIKVCDRWRVFENFLEDMGERPTSSYTIDRIDNNKGYGPENCRWANKKQQTRNRNNTLSVETVRTIKRLFSGGLTKKDIALEVGVPYNRVVDITLGRSWKDIHE